MRKKIPPRIIVELEPDLKRVRETFALGDTDEQTKKLEVMAAKFIRVVEDKADSEAPTEM